MENPLGINGENMRILGIDPGLATIGFGIVEKQNFDFEVVDYGIISTPKDDPFPERLLTIYKSVGQLIDAFKPDAIAIEELFFAKNITTGIPVSHARGVILLACYQKMDRIFEYTPMQIKLALTGTGSADKHQMQYMTKSILNLNDIPRPDDAADALAVAICHGQTNQNLVDNLIK